MSTAGSMRNRIYIECSNCGKPIERPPGGSYPPAVEWVHVMSPLGPGNRYCGFSGGVAQRASA